MVRQLSAIMFADMVGYTALMQEDEGNAKALRDRQRQVLNHCVDQFEGKILEYYGDGALSIFQSAVQAVNCAVAIQQDLAREPRVPLRIGIHVGDIVHDQEGVYGDGVNVASRIQDLSVPGGILVSGTVADEIKNHSGISSEPLGEYRLKNVQRPHAVFAITNPGVAVPTPRDVKGWPEADARKWARRKNLRLAGLLVGIGAIAGVSYWAFGDAGDPAEDPLIGLPPAFERVAVLPFTVPGDDLGPLGAVFQVNLSSLLESEVFHTVPFEEVNSFLTRSQEGEPSNLEAGKSVAELTRADLFTTGTVLTVGDSLTVTAELWNLEPGMVASASERGTAQTANALSEALALQLLIERSGTDPAFMGQLPSASDSALRYFIDGDLAYRAGDYVQAVEHLKRATNLDEDFGLAWFRLSQAATWAWDWVTGRNAAERAAATGRVSSGRIEFVTAWNDFLSGNPEVAAGNFWVLAERDPNLIEAWNGLGEVLIHYNLLRGEPTVEAKPHFERVLNIEPNYGEARFHLLEFAARERDRETFDELLMGVSPESNQHLAWRAVRAFGFGTSEEKNRIRAEIGLTPDSKEVVLATSRVLSNLQDFPAAESLAGLMTRGNRDPEWQNEIHGLIAALRFAQGQWGAAKAELALVRQDETQKGRGWALEMEALLSTFPLLDIPESEAEALRDTLRAWGPETAVAPAVQGVFLAHYQDHAALKDYALGLLALELEDRPGFMEHNTSLGRYGIHPEAKKKGRALWKSLRARQLLQQGDTSGAVQQFKSVGDFPPLELIPASPFYSRALDRWLIAEVLRKQGSNGAKPEVLRQALAWYQTLSDGWGEFLLAAPAHFRQGEIHRELGNRAEAINHYERFEELWKAADEPLAKYVQDARNARGELEAQGGG